MRIVTYMLGLARDIFILTGRLVTFDFILIIASFGYPPLYIYIPVVPKENILVEAFCQPAMETQHIFTNVWSPPCGGVRIDFVPQPCALALARLPLQQRSAESHGSYFVLYKVVADNERAASPSGQLGLDVDRGLTKTDAVAPHPIYHIENLIRQLWAEVIAILADAHEIPRDKIGITLVFCLH
ncbi:uncharacterized protein BCR38DRAFT_501598 [Pseudomassariella vexata]|uniref:Uncharacterized protein n=1 Tax=Pseudomassariella vexata TaxID=1141098 RepID=A0A1Y2DF40_9PEZI|nr:uncharacterized protein BCR38DRAFT_501598 [Pseudomassariella vexata]ORY57891.1 hypothetical protein BCR38DRAFT_501598 [Pseudomassariella vexata]